MAKGRGVLAMACQPRNSLATKEAEATMNGVFSIFSLGTRSGNGYGRKLGKMASGFAAAMLLSAGVQAAAPAAGPAAAPAPAVAPAAVATAAVPAPAAAPVATPAAVADSAPAAATATAPADAAYVPMKPTPGKGMPVDAGIDFQDQYSPNGEYAHWIHNSILMPIIVVISLFVLALLFWVSYRYRAAANPTPSKTTHNTFIEVVWTLVPVLILVGIAIPSIDLLAKQYKPAPKDAVTVKISGEQWYWTYNYPDNGGFDVVSNMLPPEEAVARGEPAQLAVDNRMVVPAGEPLRLQVTSPAAGVIHSFAVPSLWFKMDAVPGRINEKQLIINEPGVYYGQCSELCGARHGYMPIAIEALPRPQFEAWVRAQGGTVGPAEAAPAVAAPAAATPAAAAPAAPAAAAAPATPAAAAPAAPAAN